MWTEAVFLLCPLAVFWGQLSTLEIGDLLSPHYFNCFFWQHGGAGQIYEECPSPPLPDSFLSLRKSQDLISGWVGRS